MCMPDFSFKASRVLTKFIFQIHVVVCLIQTEKKKKANSQILKGLLSHPFQKDLKIATHNKAQA